MAIFFSVPTLELGVERSGPERLGRAVETLAPNGYALLRSGEVGFRVVSQPELTELVSRMSSSLDRLGFADADPICVVGQPQEIEDRFQILNPPRRRVIAVPPTGLLIAHEMELIDDEALKPRLHDFTIGPLLFGDAPVFPLGDVGLNYPMGEEVVLDGPVSCPLLPPPARPGDQPYLERQHVFLHFPGMSVCKRGDVRCSHAIFHRIPDSRLPRGARCGRCGSTLL